VANYLNEYAQAIQDKKIIACKKIKLAIKRDKADLKRAKGDDFPYYFNEVQAQKAINFIEILPTTSGESLKLELFQKWLISELFGWRKKSDETRRYSEAFISFARKNGKSFLLSTIASLYLLIEDKPAESREILFLANSFKQSKISFDMFRNGLRHLAKESPAIRKRLKLNNADVFDLESNSHATAMAANIQTLDGYRADLSIFDEWALQPNGAMKDVIKSGQINSDNALLCVISTSGNDLTSPMYKDYCFNTRVLKGQAEADDLFIAIFEQDYKNELIKSLDNPDILEKSNPLFSNKDRREVMQTKLLNQIKLANQQDNMLPLYIKNGNMWFSSRSNSYLPAKDWEAQTIKPPKIDGQKIYFGVDLSKSGDLTSVSWIIPIDNYLYVDSHSWVGTKEGLDEKIRRDRFNYRQGEKDGECSITTLKSGVVDYQDVYEFMVKFVKEHNLKVLGVCYDPWRWDFFTDKFEKIGWKLIEISQNRKMLGIPTTRFREEIFNGNIKHTDNKLLAYAINNAVLIYDRAGNPMLDKFQRNHKIDPLAALMNAYTQARDYFDKSHVIYDDEYYKNFSF